MKQIRKISAMLLTIGTVCSLLAPAGAAEANTLALRSDHAGDTMQVQVVSCDFNGNTNGEYWVDVAIPEGATKAQEQALLQAAANDAAGIPQTYGSGDPYIGDLISQNGPFTIVAAGSAQIVGANQLHKTYSRLYVTFDRVSVDVLGGADKFNVRVGNTNGDSNVYTSGTIRLGTYTSIYMFAGSHYGAGTLQLNRNDYIQVWASTDRGSASVGTVYVSAT